MSEPRRSWMAMAGVALALALGTSAPRAARAEEEREPAGGDQAAAELRLWLGRCKASVKETERHVALYRRQLDRLPKPSAAETAEDRRCRALGEAGKEALQAADRAHLEQRCFCTSACARTGSHAHAQLVRLALEAEEKALRDGRRRCEEAGAALAEREREARSRQRGAR